MNFLLFLMLPFIGQANAGNLSRLNWMPFDGLSLEDDGNVVAGAEWNRTETRTANQRTVTYRHSDQGQPQETQLIFEGADRGRLRFVAQFIQPPRGINNFQHATIDKDGNIISATVCANLTTICTTANRGLCHNLMRMEGVTSQEDLGAKLNFCSNLPAFADLDPKDRRAIQEEDKTARERFAIMSGRTIAAASWIVRHLSGGATSTPLGSVDTSRSPRTVTQMQMHGLAKLCTEIIELMPTSSRGWQEKAAPQPQSDQ